MAEPLRRVLLLALLFAAASSCAASASAARQQQDGRQESQGSLEEIRDLRHVFLLVTRNPVVDARGPDANALSEALGADPKRGRPHFYPYAVIARQLNSYIRKQGGMSAVGRASEADFIVYFNVLEYRRLLNGRYPYGEMFVILPRGEGDESEPRVIWKTRKVLWAEDAAKEFLKELKRVRGER